MVKFPYSAIVAAAVAIGLAGCASSQPAAPPPAAPAPAPVVTPPPPPPPKPMTRQQKIEALQTALNANGAQLTVDGRMGPKTTSALKAYQKKQNLKVTGQPDSATIKALGLGM